ncbi:hypothetical protein L1987_34716 [Smallanthus sonchifolius]|uniref:Uncharacterized protein n=1 Tax=Smallanthus sonchifolius TaxID=185202 RepID=A0ACB9HTV3_9ASTR|nr:hypothetical protein L1987_34716 [Smallanthus sonchifolius]
MASGCLRSDHWLPSVKKNRSKQRKNNPNEDRDVKDCRNRAELQIDYDDVEMILFADDDGEMILFADDDYQFV